VGDRRRRAQRAATDRANIGLGRRGAAPDPGTPSGPGNLLDGESRSETVAGLTEFVDADHLDEPVLHQMVERVEVFLADFPHAAIVVGAGHQIMIAWPTENAPPAVRHENGCELISLTRVESGPVRAP
jgi:hypothetical protein